MRLYNAQAANAAILSFSLLLHVNAQLAGSSNFDYVSNINNVGASSTRANVSWVSFAADSNIPGANSQSAITRSILLPVIGASGTSSIPNATLISFIATQNFLQSRTGGSSIGGSLLNFTIHSLMNELAGASSGSGANTNATVSGFVTFVYNCIIGASSNATAIYAPIVNANAGGANTTATLQKLSQVQQLVGGSVNSSSLPSLVPAYISLTTSLAGLQGNSNTTQTVLASTYYVATLCGGSSANANSSSSVSSFITTSLAGGSANTTAIILTNFATFVSTSVGASGNTAALVHASNIFNSFIVGPNGPPGANQSMIASISSKILALVGSSNAATTALSYINSSISKNADLVNFITANPGSNSATISNWINYMYLNCIPSGSIAYNLIQYNAYLQKVLNLADVSVYSSLLQGMASNSASKVIDTSNAISNLNQLLAYLSQLAAPKSLPASFRSILSFQDISASGYIGFLANSPQPIYLSVIYYGSNWGSTDMTTINNFVGAIGGSPWWSILYQYTINNQPIQQLRIANSILVSPNANNGYWFGNKLNYSSNSASQVSPAQVIANVILDQVRTNPSTTWQPVWIDAIQYFNPVCLNSSCGFSNGYLLLTSDEVSVSDIGSLGSNLATSLYGYHTYFQFSSTGDGNNPWAIYYSLVGKPSPATLNSSGSPNKNFSPNNNPAVDFVIETLAHELAEMYTNPHMTSSYYGYNSGGGLLEVADQCASIYYGTATYCVGTNALVSSAACSSGSSFVANANIGGKLYLLPSIWSIASQQCLHQPLVPSSSICSAVPTSSRVTCGDLQTAYDLSTCQSTMGCCWDTTSSTCFHSDSQSVFPTGAPFIPHINRIECTFTDKTACINGGCAWHNSSAGAIAGPSCYRKDVFRQVTMLSTTSVQPFIPPSDRITAMTGDGMLFFSTCMGSYTNLMTNAIWMPAAGQGLTNACYLNTYSGTGVGYTYITTPTTGTNQLVYCSGRSGTANDVTTLYPTLEKCLSSGNCWQVTAGYDAQLDDGIEDSSGQGTDISYGCYGGVTSSSINGGGFVNVPTAYPVTDGAPFNLYDTQGNFASLDSVNGGMKLGTSGLPISLQFNSSANNELRNKVLCAGEWTSLYAPGYGFVYQNYEEGLLSRLNSENVGIPAMTLIQSKSATNSYFIYFPEAVCYLSYDYANNVGRCRRTLDKATPWIFKPVTWTTTTIKTTTNTITTTSTQAATPTFCIKASGTLTGYNGASLYLTSSGTISSTTGGTANKWYWLSTNGGPLINVLTEKCLTNTSPVSVVDCSSAPPYWTLDSVKGGLYVTGTSSGLHAKSGGISGSAWDGDVVNTMAITVSSPYTNEMWSSVSTC